MAPLQAGTRYPVIFRAGSQPPVSGTLMVGDDHVLLEGRGRAEHVELGIASAELTAVYIGRSREEQLRERPTLVLERAPLPPVQVQPLGFGLLHELADLLVALAKEPGDDEEVVVILPLRQDQLNRARDLISKGPPFDPEVLGLTRHQVYVTADAAIFVFAGPGARAAIRQASRDPSLWRVGLAVGPTDL